MKAALTILIRTRLSGVLANCPGPNTTALVVAAQFVAFHLPSGARQTVKSILTGSFTRFVETS
jgi:hypothetical protein